MDVIAAYRDVGSYRGAAEICGTTHKTVKRIIEAHEAGQRPGRQGRGRNFDLARELVAERVKATTGRISAKRAAAGGAGGWLCRVGAELPPPRRPSQGRMAPGSSPGPPAGGVDPG
jgi:hypothetical protein